MWDGQQVGSQIRDSKYPILFKVRGAGGVGDGTHNSPCFGMTVFNSVSKFSESCVLSLVKP